MTLDGDHGDPAHPAGREVVELECRVRLHVAVQVVDPLLDHAEVVEQNVCEDLRLLPALGGHPPKAGRSSFPNRLGKEDGAPIRRLLRVPPAVPRDLNRRATPSWCLPHLAVAAPTGVEVGSTDRLWTRKTTSRSRVRLRAGGGCRPPRGRRRCRGSRLCGSKRRSPGRPTTSWARLSGGYRGT